MHKRKADKAGLRKHDAKVATADAALPAGQPPPALADQLATLKPFDIIKHEDAWRAEIDKLKACCKRMETVLEATAVVRVVIAERDAYDIHPYQRGTTITESTPLIWLDHDAGVFYDLETVDYDDQCACCDRMQESWNNWPKAYGKVEPRWRLIGQTLFLCRFCYEKLQAGDSLTTIRE